MTIWCYADINEDRWLYGGATRDDAIANGTETFGGDPFFVSEARAVDPIEVFPDAEQILQDVQENVADNFGAEDWPDLPSAQGKAFQAEWEALIKKYFPEACPFSDLLGKPERVSPRATNQQKGK